MRQKRIAFFALALLALGALGVSIARPSITADAGSGSVGVTASAAKTVSPGKAGQEVLGYYTYYNPKDKGSYNALNAYSSYLNQISAISYVAYADGRIEGNAPKDGLRLAASKHVDSFVGISNSPNGSFDKDVAHGLVSSPDVRKKAVGNILNIVKDNGYKGVNIDFEDIPAADRANFTAFIQELATSMHANQKSVYVSVTAKTSDSPKSGWVGAFDYAALGKAADRVQLMTYDENGSWGDPGPVASLPWVESVVKYAVTQIPANKILIGLPSYGYDWNLKDGKGNKAVAWKNVPKLLNAKDAKQQWDEQAASPHLDYTAEDGSKHTVWYEDSKSIKAKMDLIRTYSLAGVSMWRMGLEDESFWQVVKAGLSS